MISFYDTSTLPTDAMLEAIATARLGDDIYGLDPTVNELEAVAAELLGKEAAVLVPSGTMANLIAVLVATRPGDEVVADAEAHVLYYESGGMAAVAGAMPLPVHAERGILRAAEVEPLLRGANQHYPRTSLLWVENTHNRGGGTITRPAVMQELRELADRHGLRLHVDGARVFNAAVALDLPVADLVTAADSVSISLSKGLSAPVGALLVGSAGFIDQARRARKMLGGGMRQAGIIAAAGLVALREGVARLRDDHARARELAERLRALEGLEVDPDAVETNIVLVSSRPSGVPAEAVVRGLHERGIRASGRPPFTTRFVTHRHIGEPEVDALTDALAGVLQASRQGIRA